MIAHNETQRNYRIVVFKNSASNPAMTFVEGGNFSFGGKTVSLSSFWIRPTEVNSSSFVSFLNDLSVPSTGIYNGKKLIEYGYSNSTVSYAEGFHSSSSTKPVLGVTWWGGNVLL